MADNEELYTMFRQNDDGTQEVIGYAYGEEWVAMAMYMDDLRFATPKKAREWWERWKQHEQQKQAAEAADLSE